MVSKVLLLITGSVELYQTKSLKYKWWHRSNWIVTDDGATHDGDVTFTGANGNIVFDKSDDALEFADNVKLTFGDGGGSSDLEIYSNGTNSIS